LSQATLVLIPSFYEPFGLVALEAMRLGTPVLAAAVGGLAETVTPDSGGRLVASHDPDEWAAVIMEIMDSDAIQAQLRQQGPLYVATHFNEEQWISRLFTEAYSTQGVLI